MTDTAGIEKVPVGPAKQTLGMMEPAYLALAHREPPPLLLELEQHARHESFPLIARETGRFLSTMVHAMQANRVLEIGTGMGYATLWIALALPPAGRIWSVEPDLELGRTALSYLKRADRGDAVEIMAQTGQEVLSTFQNRQLDILFIDAPVEDYPEYLDECVSRLKLSGLLIINGLLKPEPQAEFIREFVQHPQLDATILPIGSGIGLGSRLS